MSPNRVAFIASVLSCDAEIVEISSVCENAIKDMLILIKKTSKCFMCFYLFYCLSHGIFIKRECKLLLIYVIDISNAPLLFVAGCRVETFRS